MKASSVFTKIRSKNAIRLLCFLLIFAVLLSLFTLVLRPDSNEGLHLKQYDTLDRDSIDMLYIGGSVCFASWAPYEAWNEYGITSYSYGMSSMLAYNMEPLLDEALKTQSPRLVVIDARPFSYTQGNRDDLDHKYFAFALASSMKQYTYNNLKVRYHTFKYFYDGDDITSCFFDIMAFHDNWKTFPEKLTDTSSFYRKAFDKKSNVTMGFLFMKRWERIERTDCSAVTDTAPIPEVGEQYLRELTDYLDKMHLKALFVVAPYHENPDQRRQYNHIRAVVEERGYDFLNANDDIDQIGLDGDTDFYNDNHLNIFGAEKYTSYLGKYITETYGLKDRRSEEIAAFWNEGYEKWLTEKNDTKRIIEELIKASTEESENSYESDE